MNGESRNTFLRLRHFVEAAGLRAAFATARAFNIDRASAIGGRLLRFLGPHTPLHRRGEKNLIRVMPKLNEKERQAILDGMWDNLGRLAFEWPHLPSLDPFADNQALLPDGSPRIIVTGKEILERVRDSNRSAIFATAHTANWELALLVCVRAGLPMTVVYRHAENPISDRLIQDVRSLDAVFVRKQSAGRSLLQAIRENRSIGVLNDQKLTEGIHLPFLGISAGTAAVVPAIALHHGLPLVPVRIERRGGASFRAIFEPPIKEPDPGLDRKERLRQFVLALNDRYSAWIRERPQEWLWIHRRWPPEEGTS